MRIFAMGIAVAALSASGALAADCPAAPALGLPTLAPMKGVQTTEVCHEGYVALVDDVAKVPRWVAYDLTGQHTLGCFPRKNNFHVDPALPPGSATPGDYSKVGYDKGHQAPAEDFDWSVVEMSDSFSMANMAPQVPGLNRQQWERLEASVRSWAVLRSSVTVYVGPVLSSDDKTIGRDKVQVPRGFWKVVVDDKTHETLAFYMNNEAIAKGDLAPYQTTVDAVEAMSSVSLPVPQSSEKMALWSVDLSGWTKKHQATCRK